MPVLWAARLLGVRLPEKVSGSDLVVPLARLAADRGWRVYLLGGGPGVAAVVADRLRAMCGVEIVGCDDAMISADGNADEGAVLDRIRRARPHLLLAALGSPKQELWIDRVRGRLAPVVAIGVGAAFDFISGRAARAPRWISAAGLEWLYRLLHEPRRLWRRYLVQDPAFLRIVARALLDARARRTIVTERVQA
jgi:N-acetylglucosaminyldiphosphoundecaprenol N-acetyl-beta-D-mannosaminyltransferase